MNRRNAIKGIGGGLAGLLFSSCRGIDMPKWQEDPQGDNPTVSYNTIDGPVGNVVLRGSATDADSVGWIVYDHNDESSTVPGTITQEGISRKQYEGIATTLVREGVYLSDMVATNQFGEATDNAPVWVHGVYADKLRENIADLFEQDPGEIDSASFEFWNRKVLDEINPVDLSEEDSNSYFRLLNYQKDRDEKGISINKVSFVGDSIVYHLSNANFYRFDGAEFDSVVEKVVVGQAFADKLRMVYEENRLP